MDLIYTDSARNDKGVLLHHDLDMELGSEVNDFELKVSASADTLQHDALIYIEGTEYGGIVDAISVDTEAQEITYSGRTWSGILQKKILKPYPNEDYLVLNGNANTVLLQLINMVGLQQFFVVSPASATTITISNYKMDRYIDCYSGMQKMLASVGAKLSIRFVKGNVVLSAVPVIDYTQDGELDSDAIGFKAKKTYNGVNHLVCLGSGDLKDRIVADLFANENGIISTQQTFYGLQEIAQTFEYSNAETMQDLVSTATENFKKLVSANSLDVNFDDTSNPYAIGDIVGAVENITGISVSVPIAKKIITIKDGEINVQYETDDKKVTILPSK